MQRVRSALMKLAGRSQASQRLKRHQLGPGAPSAYVRSPWAQPIRSLAPEPGADAAKTSASVPAEPGVAKMSTAAALGRAGDSTRPPIDTLRGVRRASRPCRGTNRTIRVPGSRSRHHHRADRPIDQDNCSWSKNQSRVASSDRDDKQHPQRRISDLRACRPRRRRFTRNSAHSRHHRHRKDMTTKPGRPDQALDPNRRTRGSGTSARAAPGMQAQPSRTFLGSSGRGMWSRKAMPPWGVAWCWPFGDTLATRSAAFKVETAPVLSFPRTDERHRVHAPEIFEIDGS